MPCVHLVNHFFLQVLNIPEHRHLVSQLVKEPLDAGHFPSLLEPVVYFDVLDEALLSQAALSCTLHHHFLLRQLLLDGPLRSKLKG